MSIQIQSWAARTLATCQIAAASLDFEVLQWPGGSLFASVLWIYEMARVLLTVSVGIYIVRGKRLVAAPDCTTCGPRPMPVAQSHCFSSRLRVAITVRDRQVPGSVT